MRLTASYKDPDAWLFERGSELFRQINRNYQLHYDRLMQSGLYEALRAQELIVPHAEADVPPEEPATCYKVIRPERLPFISYPYEWCFSQLKDQALAVLRIEKLALAHGMTLKDASAYNMQFRNGRPMLIDTSSFEVWAEGAPWVAYRQFCQHFLAPLAVMACRDARLNALSRAHLDGLPLDLAVTLLPWRARWRPRLLAHLVLHARLQAGYADARRAPGRPVSRNARLGLIDSLEAAVAGLTWHRPKTAWSDYYDHTNYSDEAMASKRSIVGAWIERVAPGAVWDLGASTGVFSRLASDRGIPTVAFDMDAVAVDANYAEVRRRGERCLLPLVMDLTNPSPDSGWAHAERLSLSRRGPADLALALALVHHLAIGANVPLPRVADYLASLCRWLVIEFVPKEDSQVQRMLATRKDVFFGYNVAGFEAAFAGQFETCDIQPVRDSLRRVYLMKRKASA